MRKQLEKKYGVKIVEDGYYGMNGYVKLYNVYSADGCPWTKGLRTIKAVKAECEEWASQLLRIKRIVDKEW